MAHDDAVEHDAFDALVYRETLIEATPLRQLVGELRQAGNRAADALVQDMFMLFWQDVPQLRERGAMSPTHERNWLVVDGLSRTAEVDRLREMTQLDRYSSAMAVLAVAEKAADLLEEEPEEQEQDEAPGEDDGDQESGGDEPGDGGDQLDLDATDAEVDPEAERQALAILGRAAAAVREATEKLAEENARWSSWGVGGDELERMSFDERVALSQALATSRLAKFLRLVGRFRMSEIGLRAKRVEYARDEVVGIEVSDRLQDVLSSELAARSHRVLRLDFLERLASGQLLSRRYVGTARQERGPLVFVVDESISMLHADAGEISREAWAKAFMLALLQRARSEGRDFAVIAFASRDQQKLWRFPAGRAPLPLLLTAVNHFFNGYTHYEEPLDMAVAEIERGFASGKGDIVLVTDDTQDVDPQWLETYHARKDQLGFRTFGIAVGTQAGQSLHQLADDVRSVFEFADPGSVREIFQLV